MSVVHGLNNSGLIACGTIDILPRHAPAWGNVTCRDCNMVLYREHLTRLERHAAEIAEHAPEAVREVADLLYRQIRLMVSGRTYGMMRFWPGPVTEASGVGSLPPNMMRRRSVPLPVERPDAVILALGNVMEQLRSRGVVRICYSEGTDWTGSVCWFFQVVIADNYKEIAR